MWSDRDLGYFAGIVDGEGYIALLRIKESRAYSNSFYYNGNFCISNTATEIIEWVMSRFGGRLEVNGPGKTGTRNSYTVDFRVPESLAILPVLIPYLVLKVRQAEIVYEYLCMPRGRWNWTLERRERAAILFNECSDCNQRTGKGLCYKVASI